MSHLYQVTLDGKCLTVTEDYSEIEELLAKYSNSLSFYLKGRYTTLISFFTLAE